MADEIRRCADLDERLTPYVDGEDTPTARRAVDGHLRGCASCAHDAQVEASAREIVRDHRDVLAAPAPDALKTRCAQLPLSADRSTLRLPSSDLRAPSSDLRKPSSVLRRWVPLSLAATLVLAIGGVFAFGLNDRVQALAASLAVDHVKCFKVSGTAGHADAHASEAAWQQDQGWPIAVPPSDAAEQLTLVDVRRCFSADGRAAHLMYTWRGEPLSVYVMQGEQARERLVQKLGTQAVIWGANSRVYAVVSSDTTRDLTPIVDFMKAHAK
jgi:anti-sigma factor RsiW